MAASYYCATCLHTFHSDVEQCANLACRADRPASGWGLVLGAGDTLDRHYSVEKVLAVGGAGITYLGWRVDDRGQRHPPQVAIKVLFSNRDTGSHLRRLSVEAQVLRDLDHPHIVQCLGFVHRLGEPPYLVTRFERGGDLLNAASDLGRLDPARALAVVRQVLQALDVAHRNGIVHRDLKPENVLIEQPARAGSVPRVRVTDFGVAKVMSARAGLTRVGAFIGTPEYAAPEQFVGEPATPATDVFAAGGLLYFLLTHKTAVKFTDRTDFSRCYRDLVAGCPPSLDGVPGDPELIATCVRLLEGMMHVESRTRWSTADALAIIDSLKLPPLAPPRDDQMAPLPTSDMVPHPANAPQFTGTILPEEPVAQADVRRLGEPPPGEAPPKPERRDLTLDDLFTFQDHDAPDPANLTDAPADAPPARLAPPRPAPTPKLAPPRELRRGRPPSRGSSDLLNTFDGAPPRAARPTAVGPDPDAPRAQPVKLDQHPDGTLWAPEAPLPLPAALPDAPAGALSLLGQAHPADREAVIEHLATLDDVDVIRAMRAGARSTDVAMRAGVAIGLAGLQRTELASIARSLSGDRDPGVRSLAIHALGVIGRAAALTTLSRALADKDPLVRASAALAIAKAARAAAKAAMARTWLERAARDPDPMVGAAIAQALRWLS